MSDQDLSSVVADVVLARGAELVELRVVGSRRKPLVRAFVEIPGGTTAEACAALSREIEARLESSGLVGERYTLEVSSPGLDRPLRTRRDFERQLGNRIRVQAAPAGVDAAGGGGEIVGLLERVESEGETFRILLSLEVGGETLRLSQSQILHAKPHVAW